MIAPRWLLVAPLLAFIAHAFIPVAMQAAPEIEVITNVGYLGAEIQDHRDDPRCRLDLYLPSNRSIVGTLLWLHGGGLTGGQRDSAATQRVGRRLAEAGIAVASADYRLSPNSTFPSYIEDAAAAYAWLQRNIPVYGGDPRRVFIGGHSAGAYLALMVAFDEHHLQRMGIDPETIAGVVALSGQTSTHFTVLAERNSPPGRMIVDAGAPLFHVKKRGFPIQLLFAGNDMALRIEENRLLAAALRHAGVSRVEEGLLADRTHSTILTQIAEPGDAVAERIIQFIAAPIPDGSRH